MNYIEVKKMGIYIPPSDVSPEREDEIIEKMAKLIVNKYGFTFPAIITLETIKYLTFIGGELARSFIVPFFSALSSDTENLMHEYILVFEKQRNIEQLVNRIKELEDEARQEKKQDSRNLLEKIKLVFRKNK